jgi:hypothetical protein
MAELPKRKKRPRGPRAAPSRTVRPQRKRNTLSLWQWGLLLIVASLVANLMMGQIMPVPDNSAAARGQAFGRGIGAALGVVAGVVLIVMHFVRRKGR